MVTCSVAMLTLALLVGCDSRPASDAAKAPAVPPVQGELIQAKVVTNAAAGSAAVPASVVSNSVSPAAISSTPTNSSSAPSSSSTSVANLTTLTNTSQGASLGGSNTLAAFSEPPKLVNGFLGVGFDRLSAFTFEVTDDILQSGSTNAAQVASRTAEQIPKSVMSFDQKRIALKGFMLPLKVEGGKVTEMLIMRDQSMCCYGAVPKINEWVSVKMVGEGVRPVMDQAITLYGKLYVGEMRENGYLVGIYRMDGERIDGPAEN